MTHRRVLGLQLGLVRAVGPRPAPSVVLAVGVAITWREISSRALQACADA